jgi:hypothetical protein
LVGASVSVTPDSTPPAAPAWLRGPHPFAAFRDRFLGLAVGSTCTGNTGADGRVAYPSMPPGPARVAVRFGHSTWVRRLEVAGDGREVTLQIPSGVLPLRVVDAESQSPVNGAEITWLSGGTRVDAIASVTGEALLEGVSNRPGTLTVRGPNYKPVEVQLQRPPEVLYEVALEHTAAPELHWRVVTSSGAPLSGAVVELVPHDSLEMTQVATTDREGIVRFFNLSEGPFRLIARADHYAASIVESIGVSPKAGASAIVSLARGYRAIVVLEPAGGDGPHAIRVLNERGIGMEALLDAASDRIVGRGGRVSLGPLPRGMYVIEVGNALRHRKEQIRIDNSDVQVRFR